LGSTGRKLTHFVIICTNMRQETLLEQEDNAAPSAEKAPQHTPASESDNEVNEKQTDKELDDDETDQRQDPTPFHLESVRTQPDVEATRTCTKGSSIHRELTRTSTAPYTQERFDIEQGIEAERTTSIAIAPTKTADGTILVDWYTIDDPANPQNVCSFPRRCFSAMQDFGNEDMPSPVIETLAFKI